MRTWTLNLQTDYNMESNQPTLTFSPERYATLHKLISLGLDALPDDKCTEDVLGAVAWFSATGALYEGYENYDPLCRLAK
jgi:hypothetical protein